MIVCYICRQHTAANPCDSCGAAQPSRPEPPAEGAHILRIGDIVWWRGAWGEHPARLARVEGIDATERGEKYGQPVDEIAWARVTDNRALISLHNGHWAYGYQVRPATAAEAAGFTGRAS